MSALRTSLFLAAIAASAAGSTFAQHIRSSTSPAFGNRGVEQATAATAERAEMARHRADCEKQASEQKLHLPYRARFLHDCLHQENK